MDTNGTSFGLELSKDNGWVFFFPRDDIGGIKPIDFAPIMGIREVDPHPRYFEKAAPDSVNRFSCLAFSRFLQSWAVIFVDSTLLHSLFLFYFYSSVICDTTKIATKINIFAISLSLYFLEIVH